MAKKQSTEKTSRAVSHSSKKSARPEYAKDVDIESGKKRRIPIKRSHILILLFILALGTLLYYFRGVFIAATINGEPVSRLSVISELEKQSGSKVLNSIVTKTLIRQEAKKKNVSITDGELTNEIKRIEENLSKQNQKLDDVLAMQGLSRQSLQEEIRLQKLVEKMVGKDIQVAGKEVDEYIEKNKESLPQDQKPEDLKKQVKEQLRQQKLNEKIQTWIQDLQKKAKINYFVEY